MKAVFDVSNMDGIIGTKTGDSSVVRYSLRSEKNKFLGDDNDHNEHSTIGNDSQQCCSRNSSDDPPLSEYELLRLLNIKRNEARLAQLGLLVPAAAGNNNKRRQSSNNDGGETSALTTLLLASPQPKKKRQKENNNAEPLPRRILPKRHCTTSRCDNGYDTSDESSIAASPIFPKRILTLQPHQAVAVAVNNEDVQCPRRERRGRPRLEDYVYVCDEVCGHCGGEWKLDGDEDAEEETRLIR